MCSERSGSNLLRSMFDSHPEFFAPPPTHVLRTIIQPALSRSLREPALWDEILEKSIRQANRYSEKFLGSISADEVRKHVAPQDIRGLYRHLITARLNASEKPRLLIKENHIHLCLPTILEWFPNTRFLFQTRDPRDYCLSCMRTQKKGRMHYGSMLNAIHVWQRDQSMYLAFQQAAPDRVHHLRYEDLVEEPEKELKKACAFLGTEFSSEMLNFHERDNSRRSATLNPQYWGNLVKPVQSCNHHKYHALGAIRLEAIEEACAPLMHCWNYETEYITNGNASLLSRAYMLQSRIRNIFNNRKAHF